MDIGSVGVSWGLSRKFILRARSLELRRKNCLRQSNQSNGRGMAPEIVRRLGSRLHVSMSSPHTCRRGSCAFWKRHARPEYGVESARHTFTSLHQRRSIDTEAIPA
ncbi:hypothetical protein M409DRAFT_54625 [Zasmidium cellare ATCC 36951]|uniref:Uncharacterized protein n=1 Tax=Zasmidium cellare ATCC 36951 TaxID=1080233 RepID=A0A6A6CN19_ZASCE|nr:uncharacterized protein M409DRAFT_54625 [Zasmidium cellare ATCC 36951]KAF2166846.1 hypothetical protein M409DRAFT_54625 [Zasmidium cellare ATCC 36951]